MQSYNELVGHERECWEPFESDKHCHYCDHQLEYGQSLPQHRRDECLCCYLCFAQQRSIKHRYEHQAKCFQHESRRLLQPIDEHTKQHQQLKRLFRPNFVPTYVHGRVKSQQQLAHYLATDISGAIHLTGPTGSGKTVIIQH